MAAPDPTASLVVAPREFVSRGESLTLRPLGPADAARLQEFFYSHTFDTIQMRYGHAVTRMTPERAFDLVNVDQKRDLAIAIFEADGPRQIIHAVARYYLDPDGRSAEIAFVVRESKRRRGLGRVLMQTLVDVARARGLDALWGRVRRDNQPMLALFRQSNGEPAPAAEAGDTDLEMRIALQAPPPPSPALAPARHARGGVRKKPGKGRAPRATSR